MPRQQIHDRLRMQERQKRDQAAHDFKIKIEREIREREESDKRTAEAIIKQQQQSQIFTDKIIKVIYVMIIVAFIKYIF